MPSCYFKKYLQPSVGHSVNIVKQVVQNVCEFFYCKLKIVNFVIYVKMYDFEIILVWKRINYYIGTQLIFVITYSPESCSVYCDLYYYYQTIK